MDRTLRLFLALLALVAGAAGAPVQARMTAGDAPEVERVESGRASGVSTIAAVQAQVLAQAKGGREVRERARTRRASPITVVIPSIQYGDRLLE